MRVRFKETIASEMYAFMDYMYRELGIIFLYNDTIYLLIAVFIS